MQRDWNFPFRKEPTAVKTLLKKLIDQLLASGTIEASRYILPAFRREEWGYLTWWHVIRKHLLRGISICGAGEPTTQNYLQEKFHYGCSMERKTPLCLKSFSNSFIND
jgi:hypothetical protein